MKFKRFLDDLTEKLCHCIPKNPQVLKQDIEKNIKSILNSAFSKLDLVTREEFDAQTKVLARSRQKIEALELKLRDLEQSLKNKESDK